MDKSQVERPHATAWSHAVFVYVVLHLMLTAALLAESAESGNAQAIARATFQLLTCVAMLPAWRASRTRRTLDYGAGALRPAVVCAFALAIALLVDAFLRLLTALTVLFYARSRAMFAFSAAPVLAQTALYALGAAVFRLAPPPSNLGPGGARRLLAKRPMRSGGGRSLEERARTPASALHAVFLHSVCGLLARSVDLALLSPEMPVVASAAMEIGAAGCAAMIVWPLLRMTTNVLIHATPPKLVGGIAAGMRSIAAREGVIDCRNVHVWEEAPGIYVGTLSVRIQDHVSAAAVLQFALQAFDGIVNDLTVQVETCRDPARVGGLNSAGAGIHSEQSLEE